MFHGVLQPEICFKIVLLLNFLTYFVWFVNWFLHIFLFCIFLRNHFYVNFGHLRFVASFYLLIFANFDRIEIVFYRDPLKANAAEMLCLNISSMLTDVMILKHSLYWKLFVFLRSFVSHQAGTLLFFSLVSATMTGRLLGQGASPGIHQHTPFSHLKCVFMQKYKPKYA